jgi:hypothetical protein
MQSEAVQRAMNSRQFKAFLAAVTFALASVLGAAPAHAGVADPGACSTYADLLPEAAFFEDYTAFDPLDQLVQGQTYTLHFGLEWGRCLLVGFDAEDAVRLDLRLRFLDGEGEAIDWSSLFVGEAFEGVTEQTFARFEPEAAPVAEGDEDPSCFDDLQSYLECEERTSSGLLYLFELRSDAALGAFSVEVTAIVSTPAPEPVSDDDIELDPTEIAPAVNGGDYLLFVLSSTESPFEVVASPVTTVGSPTQLSCVPTPPVVGGTVTCTVTGPPGIDILWTAEAGGRIATGPVRIGADGTGTLSFVVPSSALGREVFVELVEWNPPLSLGVASGPLPGSVPAGEGRLTPSLVGPWLLLLGTVVAVLRQTGSRRKRQVVSG